MPPVVLCSDHMLSNPAHSRRPSTQLFLSMKTVKLDSMVVAGLGCWGLNSMAYPYTAKSGKQQYRPTIEEIEVMDAEGEGFCLACGETQCGVEPDASRYKCESCGALKVYGAMELVLMGLVY